MHRDLFKRIGRGIVPFVIFFGSWILLTEVWQIKDVFLPTIPRVFSILGTLFLKDKYAVDMFVSIYRVMAAFAISAVLAIPLGLYTGHSKRMAEVVEPFVGF